MSFERARNKEQKNERINQIKIAALKQYEEKQYYDITLASIAKELNFTRGNLYKYVKSKDEIFLEIIYDDLLDWEKSLKEQLSNVKENDLKTFAYVWANTMNNHQRCIKLLSILFTVIEQNASLEKLTLFKKRLLNLNKRIFNLVKKSNPDLSDDSIMEFLSMQISMAVGLQPLSNPHPKQLKAAKLTGIPYVPPDFVKSFSNFVIYTIEGMIRNS